MDPSGYEDINLGLNLAQFAIDHVEFLKEVNKHPQLYGGPVLQRAIWRYTELWLPLVVEHKLEDLSAPIDIEWVWHCHMLAPLLYESDCMRLFQHVPEHRIISKSLMERSCAISKSYWENKYPNEPFVVDLDGTDLVNGAFMRSRTNDTVYNLTAAADRQKVFYYQVSLPHYRDKTFLKNSVVRYQKFLYLKYRYPNVFLVPCYDIDVIWHSHMNFPSSYKNLTEVLLGKILHHDDSVNDRSEGSKLSVSDKNTRGLWRAVYNEHFSSFGGMYRGDPPWGKLQVMTDDMKIVLFSKDTIINFNKVELCGYGAENLGKHKVCITEKDYTIMRDHRGMQEKIDLSEQLISLKGPPSVWDDVGHIEKSLGCLTADNLYIQVLKMQSFLCCTSGTLLEGEGRLNMEKISQQLTKRNKQVVDKLVIELDNNLKADVDIAVTFSKLGNCDLWLVPGTFEDCVMPEQVEQLWGPVPLPRLPPGIDNKCSVASHKLQDYKRQIQFTCRLVHSLPLMMSAVQVFHHDKMVVVAHVIGSDQLPKPYNVNDKSKCVTLDPRKGERALLIKNNAGDWGILVGRWEGFKRGIPPKNRNDRGGRPGNPGYLTVSFYHVAARQWENVSMEETYAKEEFRFKLWDAEIDLKHGKIGISGENSRSIMHGGLSNEVPEHLALAFSVSLLHVLVQPRPSNWEPGQSLESQANRRGVRAVRAIKTDKMTLVLAAGLMIATPSNHHIRSKFIKHGAIWGQGGTEDNDENDEDNQHGGQDDNQQDGRDETGPTSNSQDGHDLIEDIGNLITENHDNENQDELGGNNEDIDITFSEEGGISDLHNDTDHEFGTDIYLEDFNAFYGDMNFGDSNTDTGVGIGDSGTSEGIGFSDSGWGDGDAGGCGGCGGGFGGGAGGDGGGSGGGGFGGAFDSGGGWSGGAFDSGGDGAGGSGGGWLEGFSSMDMGGGDGGGGDGFGGGDGGFGGGDGGGDGGGCGGCGGGCGG